MAYAYLVQLASELGNTLRFPAAAGILGTRWIQVPLQVVLSCGYVALLAAMLASLEWRSGFALVAGVVILIAAVVIVWTLRGQLIEHTMETLVRRITPSTRLENVKSPSRHILCATEVQTSETVYFTKDAIMLRGHRPYSPNLTTARVVCASAAFPLAFPPVIINGIPFFAIPMFAGPVSFGPLLNTLILVDGGVRDNLGFGWFEEQRSSIDELVVVSAAPNRHRAEPLNRFPGFTELAAFLRISFLPYNLRERLRRRIVASHLHEKRWDDKPKTPGAIVHIEDSPFDLADLLIARAEQSQRDDNRTPHQRPHVPDHVRDQMVIADQIWGSAGAQRGKLLERAHATIAHLNALESSLPVGAVRLGGTEPPAIANAGWPDTLGVPREQFDSGFDFTLGARSAWENRVGKSISVNTTFAAIDVDDAENLLFHGYYLTCANLHVTLNWPLLDGLNTERLGHLMRVRSKN
jgi:predicted acylesterase/phospholipase RssA